MSLKLVAWSDPRDNISYPETEHPTSFTITHTSISTQTSAPTLHAFMPSSSYAPLADEVNPPFSKSTPAPIVTRSGTITYRQEDERDLGEMPRFSRYDKGKGKERSWDVEQGQHDIQEIQSYPPISSEEEDERRIQAVSHQMRAAK